MTFIVGLALGFLGAAIMAMWKPELFNKITVALGMVAAVAAGLWDKIPQGWFQ